MHHEKCTGYLNTLCGKVRSFASLTVPVTRRDPPSSRHTSLKMPACHARHRHISVLLFQSHTTGAPSSAASLTAASDSCDLSIQTIDCCARRSKWPWRSKSHLPVETCLPSV